MDKTVIRDRLKARGWKEDRWGHVQKQSGDRKFRIKFQDLSCRVEVQVHHSATPYSPATTSWVRLSGAYYKDVVDLSTGALKIGTFLFKKEAG